MSNKQSNDMLTKIILAVLFIVVGILFIVKRAEILGITFTVLGAALIVLGLVRLLRDKDILAGIILATIGVIIIVFGWALSQAACVIAGAILIAYSIYMLIKKQVSGVWGWVKLILNILVGIFLILGIVDTSWVFIVIGVLMIVYGISFLLN